MNHEIRVIGMRGRKKYLLFYITMTGTDKKEIHYGIPRFKVTRHNSGINNIYFDGKRVDYDINKYFREKGLKFNPMRLDEFKGIEGFGTLVPIQDCKNLIKELQAIEPYHKKRKKGHYHLDLNKFKGTINIQPIITTFGIKKIKDFFKSNIEQRKKLIIYKKSNPKIAIQILDIYKKEE